MVFLDITASSEQRENGGRHGHDRWQQCVFHSIYCRTEESARSRIFGRFFAKAQIRFPVNSAAIDTSGADPRSGAEVRQPVRSAWPSTRKSARTGSEDGIFMKHGGRARRIGIDAV